MHLLLNDLLYLILVIKCKGFVFRTYIVRKSIYLQTLIHTIDELCTQFVVTHLSIVI